MCCFVTALFMVGPRLAILVWWIMNPVYIDAIFQSWRWPLLGFIFLPWSTLSYMAVYPAGIEGFDWIILGLGVALDIFTYVGGYRQKDAVPYGESIP